MTDESAPKLCPKGHPVRHIVGNRRCSGVRCAEDIYAEHKSTRVLDLDRLKEIPPEEAQAQERHRLAKMPKNLKGDDAVKWAQEKMVELLPEAIANINWNLRYGTNKQRDEATDRVLKANGMDKKDAGNTGTHGLIVLNLNNTDTTSLPWLQRMKGSEAKLAPTVISTPEEDDS